MCVLFYIAGVPKKTTSKKARSRILGSSHRLRLESLPDDSINSVLHSKESVRRGSHHRDSTVSNGTCTDDLESVFSDDSSLHNTRIGFCDTPEQTMERKTCE